MNTLNIATWAANLGTSLGLIAAIYSLVVGRMKDEGSTVFDESPRLIATS